MKIAYLCDLNPLEKWTYSGGNFRIYKALEEQGAQIDILTPSWYMAEPLRKLNHSLPDSINLRARWRMHLLMSRIIARGVNKALVQKSYDVLFCPYSFQSLANVQHPKHTLQVFTADATPTTYRTSEISAAFGSSSLSRKFDPMITRAESRIFRNTDLNLWPSSWQKNLADDVYNLDPQKSIVVPWGANIPDPMDRTVQTPAPTKDGLQLLLVGRDWFAKGGPLAFETLKNLRNQGINAHLTVVGCTPPDFHTCEAMTVIASLDKTKPQEFAQFESIFRKAHFLIMPSFESYGFAFCEASAYGLPSLCLRLGGVPVEDGVNGYALDITAQADDFTRCILPYLEAPERYFSLRKSSRSYYETALNWTAWGTRVASLISSRMAAEA